MKSYSKYFTKSLVALLIFLPGILMAQEEEEPSRGLPSESGLEISLDVPKLAGIFLDFETKFEGAVGIKYKTLVRLAFEAGYGELKPEKAIKNGDYTSEGIYGRLGLDLIIPLDLKNSLYLGGRYGRSRFDERAEFGIESDVFDDFQDGYERTDMEADWGEIVLGTETNFTSNFYFGWIFRFRILGNYDQFDEPFEVYAIPGYGRAMDKTIPAINFYIKYFIKV